MNNSRITPKRVKKKRKKKKKKKKKNETWSNKCRRSFSPIQTGTMILFYTSNKNFSLSNAITDTM